MSDFGQGQPKLGATFYPGGSDDFYMPELVAPAPQRLMPEVPENMQENLAQLEYRAQSPTAYNHMPPSQSTHQLQSDYRQHHNPYQSDRLYDYFVSDTQRKDQPNFSPFPALSQLPPNVPPTDDQKEASLEAARGAVLASNDPEMQLTWAEDALTYVETAMQNEQRISAIQPARSHTPQVEHMLKEDAMKIVSFLADQHHPKADFLRGLWLEFGKFGVRIDKKEAFLCYNRALEKGYIRAYYRIGMQFEQSNEALKAISYYQKGADAGDSAACYRLGMMALLGQHSQPQNYQRGLNLIYASAQTADGNAAQGAYVFGMLQARDLAQISIPERFLPLDIQGAKMNIEKAASLGFAKAQAKMGAAYELCEMGCEFNPALSMHYNNLAARQGEADAEMALSKWFLCGYEGLFEKNEELAFTYAKRAAQSGLPTAQFAIGYFYEVGIFVPMNLKEAREWYSKASSNGNKDALGRIDSISRSKTISRKDHERIAVSRIRQQHGSHGQSPTAASPTSLQPTIDMPDPSRLSLSQNTYSNPHASARPPSTAPYPEDHGRPSLALSDARPTSAFGINPNLRPSSVASIGSTRPDPYRLPNVQGTPRPLSSTNMGDPRYSTYNHSPPVVLPSTRPQQQPGLPPVPPKGGRPDADTVEPAPVRADIGFVAPLDASGADRRQRLQRQQHSGAGKPQSTPTPASTAVYPPRKTSRLPGAPEKPVISTSRTSAPAKANDMHQPAVSASSKPLPSPAPQKSSRQPGKGPKTFEEMSLPQGKAENDCVIM